MRLVAKRRKYEAALRRRRWKIYMSGGANGLLLLMILMVPPLLFTLGIFFIPLLLWLGWHLAWHGYTRSRLRHCPDVVGVRLGNGQDTETHLIVEPRRRRRLQKVLPFTCRLTDIRQVAGKDFSPIVKYTYELPNNDFVLLLGTYLLKVRVELDADTSPATLVRAYPAETPEAFREWVRIKLNNHFAQAINNWKHGVTAKLKKKVEELHSRRRWSVGSCKFIVTPLLLEENGVEVWNAKHVVVVERMPVNGKRNGKPQKVMDPQVRHLLIKHGHKPPPAMPDSARSRDVFIK